VLRFAPEVAWEEVAVSMENASADLVIPEKIALLLKQLVDICWGLFSFHTTSGKISGGLQMIWKIIE